MALVATPYCTATQLDRYVSSAGVVEFADHDDDGSADDEVVNDCINEATEEINGYCQQRYAPADLAGSTLVNRWAVKLAAYFLTQRRGNPPPDSFAMEFQRVVALLEKVAAGAYQLPGVALRADLRPSWSNLRVDRRYGQRKIRVKKDTSSDSPTELRQNVAWNVNEHF